MMKKVILFLLVAVSFAMMGCAPTAKGSSNFDTAYPLKGESVVIVTSSHKDVINFANKVSTHLAATLTKQGVNAVAYVKNEESVALSDNPVVDFAREKNAKYILVQNFSNVKLLNSALSEFNEELAIIKVEGNTPIWKATIDFQNPMAMGFGPGVKGAVNKTVEMLKTDGFI